MRIFGKFLIALGLVALTALPVAQAAEGTDKTPEQQALQELSAKLSSGQNSSYACPIGSGGSGGSGGNAQNAAAAINAFLTPEKIREASKRWGVSTKNLPPGNYRERCYGCLTQPGEEGERVLSCVCPVKTGAQRLIVNLDKCKEGTEITYCADMLVCGKCMYTDSASADNGADAAASAKVKQETDMILRTIGRGAP